MCAAVVQGMCLCSKMQKIALIEILIEMIFAYKDGIVIEREVGEK